MVRNDGTPNEKKFLSITPRKIRVSDDQYIYYNRVGYNYGDRILAKDVPEHDQHIPALYDHYDSQSWAENKKYQLWGRLNNIAYIIAFIELHLKGYRIIEYSDWSHMLKWLSNLEDYRINKYSGNVNFVKSSEYGRYMCKIAGKLYPCGSLKINYYKTGYLTIEGKLNSIDFLDSKNNCEYVQRVFRAIDSLPK
jgi:hypothetical protein